MDTAVAIESPPQPTQTRHSSTNGATTPLTAVDSVLSETYVFRPIQQSDRDRVKELHEDWFPVVYQDEFYDDLVQERLAGKKLHTCVATFGNDVESSDGQIVSCVVGSFISWAKLSRRMQALLVPDKTRFRRLFYIMTLGTVEEHRKTGLASVLLRWIESLVQQDPLCGGIYLHVITYNESAIRFYERLGFYRVEEIPDYYEIDGQKYASYLYAKYFHGNRGHWDLVRVVRQALMSLWRNIAYWIPSGGGDSKSSNT